MANKQTKQYRKFGVSTLNQGASPGFKTFPLGSQDSKRTKKWGESLPKSSRDIIYPEEFKNRAKH